MSKLQPMKFFCPLCDKYAVADSAESTAQWEVFPPRCPDCGRKWELEWDKPKPKKDKK